MLQKLTVRTRLILLLVVTVAALVAMGVMQIVNVRLAQEELDHVYLGGAEEMNRLTSVSKSYSSDIVTALNAVINGSSTPQQCIEAVRRAQDEAAVAWNAYSSADNYISGDTLQAAQKSLASSLQQLLKRSEENTFKLDTILKGQNKSEIARFAQDELYPQIAEIEKTLDQLIALHNGDTRSDYQTAQEETKAIVRSAMLAVIITLLIIVTLVVMIIKSIVGPLEYAVDKVNRLAEGDTAIEVQNISGGELGSLLEAVRNTTVATDKMGLALASIASGDLTGDLQPRSPRDVLGHALNNMLIKMRKMIGEIQDDVNIVSSSSEEIMTSLSQLSAGAAETAAAVTETTTTVEELKQTAHLSAEKAKEVLTSTEETVQAVKSSEDSVTSTIDDMKQIQDKMQIISDSILKLSEKGLAIAEIMDTVNDLAEQSNLLAVNAAIEAAKAGEQGRSFGVVAQEIRTLAEQSKGATVQVRSLLNEIQNATNAAVLATEQGSKAVSKGVNQSVHTNKTIKTMVDNTSKVAHAANQIVLSSQQQLVGIEQVTTAMTNIDEATSQHAQQLTQIKSALESMSKVSALLKQLTDQYRLSVERSRLTQGRL